MTVVRYFSVLVLVLGLCAFGGDGARADAPTAYAGFIKDATAQRGLFTLWHKDGKLYLELSAAQLDHDYVQTIVPSSGLGGSFLVAGNTDHLPSELVRFERSGNQVAVLWPQPYFIAPHSEASQLAIARNFPSSIVALCTIAAQDASNGTVVIDATPFLDDQLNLRAVFAQSLRTADKSGGYELDRERSYFGSTKAFPKNVVIEALQDWTSDSQRINDVAPDPRHVQMHVTYNIADVTPSPDYRPRYADDRVGLYDDIYLTFDRDQVLTRKLRYLVRWNLQPSDPSRPVSPASHPMVFVMSDTVPPAQRPAIKAAVLKWNDAFLKLGISDALQVIDQPKDAAFDPDDIRYNVLRWVTEDQASFGADSQTLFDPRTGEEFRTGVLISADEPMYANMRWTYEIDPVRFGRSTDPMPQSYLDDVWLSTIMHETGHNLGMQHNFVGSRAYTAKQLQDPVFTAKYGIASTVMEYAPTNLWPRPSTNGTYDQTVLGPYDYYAMRYGYGVIPGAKTPEDELPELGRIASAWSNPLFRYASDEDVSWENGHAADPRAEQGILTNDMLGWCDVQLGMDHALMAQADRYFPRSGAAFEDERDAFALPFRSALACAELGVRFIGGQYLSRAHRGDPGAEAPIVPVPKADQRRAYQALTHNLFDDSSWRVPAHVLADLGYSEWAGYGYVGFDGYGNLPKWAYDPPARHDYRYGELIAAKAAAALDTLFSAPVLARIAAGAAETADRDPMRLADLFAWVRDSLFGSAALRAPDDLQRALQAHDVERMTQLYTAPAADAPPDARALGRAALVAIAADATLAAARTHDPTLRAHFAFLAARAREGSAGKRS